METYKIVILGSGGVGKSALVLRYVCDEFLEEHDPTIEDTYRKETQVKGNHVVLDILDTAGQEEFRSMQDDWITGGDGFIIVYDITAKLTFEEVSNFKKQIRKNGAKQQTPILLVGNKCDLEDRRDVLKSDAEDLAKSWSPTSKFLEASAKGPDNVEKAFETIAVEIRESRSKSSASKPKKKGFCVLL